MRNGDFSEVAAAYPTFRLYNPATGGAGGVGRDAVPEQRHPVEPDQPGLAAGAAATIPLPNTAADLNAQPAAPTTSCSRARCQNDRDNYRHQAHLPALALAHHLGQVRHARRRGRRQLHPRLRRGQPRRHAHLRRRPRPHLDAQPDASCSTATSASTARTSRSPAPTTARTSASTSRHPAAPTAPTSAPSGLPDFDIPTADTGGTNYDIGTTPNWMPLFRKERSYTFSTALTWCQGPAPGAHRHRRRAPRAEPLPGRVRQLRRRARRVPLQRHRHRRPRLHPAGLERARRLPARPARPPAEGRPDRGDDRPRVADRPLRQRPLAREREADR